MVNSPDIKRSASASTTVTKFCSLTAKVASHSGVCRACGFITSERRSSVEYVYKNVQ